MNAELNTIIDIHCDMKQLHKSSKVMIYRIITSEIRFGGGGGGWGGGEKIMCAHAHHEREARSPLRPGSRARLRALEALGFLMMLSHAI